MTVTLRKLTPEESDQFFGSQSSIDLTDYLEALNGLEPGDAFEVPITDGITTRSTKRRFNKAAEQTGKRLRWSSPSESNDGKTLYARVVLQDAAAKKKSEAAA